MTTTTPESRARLAYVAYSHVIARHDPAAGATRPLFDDLTPLERECWLNSSRVLWELATTGRAEL